MRDSRPSRLPAARMLVLALMVALASVISSVMRPHAATAQTVYCGPSLGYQLAGCSYNGNVYCNGQVGYGACLNQSYTSCAGGVTVVLGYPCPSSGCTGSGTCYNNPYGTSTSGGGLSLCGTQLVYGNGPCVPTPANATTAAGATGQVSCGNGRYAPTVAACPPATVASAGSAATVASSSSAAAVVGAPVSCAGTGVTAPSQSQCPLVCYTAGSGLPLYEAAGSTCPSGTTTTPSAASASAGATGAGTSALGPSNGVSVAFPAGWSLVAQPEGSPLNGTVGPLYTFQAGDTAYETVPSGSPAKAGYGYWAYFASNATLMLPLTTSGSVQVSLPAGTPVLIGNPGSSPATVSGATTVSTFDARSNGYTSATTLKPGQGAWATSDTGGTVTISNQAG